MIATAHMICTLQKIITARTETTIDKREFDMSDALSSFFKSVGKTPLLTRNKRLSYLKELRPETTKRVDT